MQYPRTQKYPSPPRPCPPALGNFLYTLQTGLELAAFYRLRTALPGLRRPYQIPGGRLGAVLVMALPCATLVAVAMTIAAPAAGFGSVIAAGTVVAAHVVFRRRALRREAAGEVYVEAFSAAHVGDDNGGTGRGEGLAWEVKVYPSTPEGENEEGQRIGVFDEVGSGAKGEGCRGSSSEVPPEGDEAEESPSSKA